MRSLDVWKNMRASADVLMRKISVSCLFAMVPSDLSSRMKSIQNFNDDDDDDDNDYCNMMKMADGSAAVVATEKTSNEHGS